MLYLYASSRYNNIITFPLHYLSFLIQILRENVLLSVYKNTFYVMLVNFGLEIAIVSQVITLDGSYWTHFICIDSLRTFLYKSFNVYVSWLLHNGETYADKLVSDF
jgi:hypothetical protein